MLDEFSKFIPFFLKKIVKSELYKIYDWSPARSSWCSGGHCNNTGNQPFMALGVVNIGKIHNFKFKIIALFLIFLFL